MATAAVAVWAAAMAAEEVLARARVVEAAEAAARRAAFVARAAAVAVAAAVAAVREAHGTVVPAAMVAAVAAVRAARAELWVAMVGARGGRRPPQTAAVGSVAKARAAAAREGYNAVAEKEEREVRAAAERARVPSAVALRAAAVAASVC